MLPNKPQRPAERCAELLTDAAASRGEYLENFTIARTALARRLAASGIRHAETFLDQPLDAPLRQLFGHSKRRGSAR